MTRGRKPKPTALKILDGNPGRGPLNTQAPKFPLGFTPPQFDDPEASAAWARIVPSLESVGLLTRVDRDTLIAYCESWATYREAKRHLRDEGYIVEGAKGGEVRSSWEYIRKQALAEVIRIASEFGFTPASRERIKAGGDRPPGDDETQKKRDKAARMFGA